MDPNLTVPIAHGPSYQKMLKFAFRMLFFSICLDDNTIICPLGVRNRLMYISSLVRTTNCRLYSNISRVEHGLDYIAFYVQNHIVHLAALFWLSDGSRRAARGARICDTPLLLAIKNVIYVAIASRMMEFHFISIYTFCWPSASRNWQLALVADEKRYLSLYISINIYKPPCL